jgi:putative tryptophan/tyrosine transport system substrate-binding protein
VKRREFITLVGGAAAAWPLVARAQQPALPVIGFLHSASPGPYAKMVAAFREGLKDTGRVEGRNVAIEFRWAEGDYDRLPALAAELVRRPVAVIAAVGGNVSALAAKAASSTVPIVFNTGSDPIKSGLVASFNRPGGNVTGVSFFGVALGQKRLELIRELVPNARTMAMLVNPAFPDTEIELNDVQTAARAVGQQIYVLIASSEREIDTAFGTAVQKGTGAILVSSDPFFNRRRDQLVALSARHAVPTIYQLRDFADAGGLMSYGNNFTDLYRQVGVYAGRILNGEKPTDLPVVQPTKFELIINLKTAKALGLTVPDKLLVTADEVIE